MEPINLGNGLSPSFNSGWRFLKKKKKKTKNPNYGDTKEMQIATCIKSLSWIDRNMENEALEARVTKNMLYSTGIWHSPVVGLG